MPKKTKQTKKCETRPYARECMKAIKSMVVPHDLPNPDRPPTRIYFEKPKKPKSKTRRARR